MAALQNQHVSRRTLFKHVGMTGSAMTLFGGCATFHDSSAVSTTSKHAQRTTSQTLDSDVVVVGGGMAGVCAAISAARNGARVVLVQDRPVLGGNASSEIRMHICGADKTGSRNEGDTRESGIIEELRLEDSVRNPQRSASMFDLLLYEWVKREPNITLLLNTSCYGVQMTSFKRLASITALRPSTEDVFTIKGTMFIDCSGDGCLGAKAGADFRMGREAQDEYNESLAPAQADNETLGSTLLFMTHEHDRPMPFVAPDWIRDFPQCKDLPMRRHHAWEYGYWWVEWGGELDTIKDNEIIRDELLAAALGVWDHIKNSGQHPTSERWALDWIGFVPGKRESRRFIGDHVLTQGDLEKGGPFNDGVGYGGWGIDLHPTKGIYSTERPFEQTNVPLYNIPLRSLYSRNVENLLFAGRNISASHIAFGSTRVMATCSVSGQAVGTTAALCCRDKCNPRDVSIDTLQQTLLADDAYIVGCTNHDSKDYARNATVTASSETPNGLASKVIDGTTRGVSQETHRWISDPQQPLPQWIELTFDKPTHVSEVRLTFDTGLHRGLTLTHSDAVNSRIIKGPQPETVKDYEVQLLNNDEKATVAKVTNNHQRQRIHAFEPQTATGIRIKVLATNGDKSARIFEVRAV